MALLRLLALLREWLLLLLSLLLPHQRGPADRHPRKQRLLLPVLRRPSWSPTTSALCKREWGIVCVCVVGEERVGA